MCDYCWLYIVTLVVVCMCNRSSPPANVVDHTMKRKQRRYRWLKKQHCHFAMTSRRSQSTNTICMGNRLISLQKILNSFSIFQNHIQFGAVARARESLPANTLPGCVFSRRISAANRLNRGPSPSVVSKSSCQMAEARENLHQRWSNRYGSRARLRCIPHECR